MKQKNCEATPTMCLLKYIMLICLKTFVCLLDIGCHCATILNRNMIPPDMPSFKIVYFIFLFGVG